MQIVGDEETMTIYSLVLFLHVGAALTLASALAMDALILFELRGDRTLLGTRDWNFGPESLG